jgi:hypothetical protein
MAALTSARSLASAICVDHLHMNLRVKLLQVQLGLAIFDQRASLIGLRGPVAQRDIQIEAHTLVRRSPVVA